MNSLNTVSGSSYEKSPEAICYTLITVKTKMHNSVTEKIKWRNEYEKDCKEISICLIYRFCNDSHNACS